MFLLGLGKDQKQCSDSDYTWRIKSRVEHLHRVPELAHRDDPCRDRRTDIGTHDDTDCLRQVQHSRTYETDYHNRRRTTALDDRRDQGAERNCHHTVVCQFSKKRTHLASRRLLHTIRHDAHAVQEHAESAQKTKQV